MFKRFAQIMAFTLVVVLFVGMIPVSAVAEIKDDIMSSIRNHSLMDKLESFSEDTQDEISADVSYEVTSLRTENTKTFLMSDGTYTVASYNQPVHYRNDNDLWVDIDNSLELLNGEYVNKANDFFVKFASSVLDDNHVEISKDKYSLSWEYLPAVSNKLNNLFSKINCSLLGVSKSK